MKGFSMRNTMENNTVIGVIKIVLRSDHRLNQLNKIAVELFLEIKLFAWTKLFVEIKLFVWTKLFVEIKLLVEMIDWFWYPIVFYHMISIEY